MTTNEILGLAGGTALGLTALAWFAERRRLRRSDLDKVGWVPWTSVFFWALLAAVLLLGLMLKAWLAS